MSDAPPPAPPPSPSGAPEDPGAAAVLAAAFREAPSFLHVLRGPDFVFEFANEAYYRLVGRRDLLGRPAFTVLPEAAAGGFPARLAEVLATGRAFVGRELPVTLARTPGAPPEERLIDLEYLPLADADGRVTRVLGYGTDVTEHVHARRRGEAALDAERRRLAEIVRLAPAFMAVLRGPDHVFELTNAGYDALVGHRTVLGRPVAEALPEAAAQGFVALLDRVLATDEPFIGREVPYRRPDAAGVEGERYVDFVYQALTEADGTRSGVFVHGVDVTEAVEARRAAERLLAESERARADAEAARAEAEAASVRAQAAYAAAAAASQAKGEFLATMSHELRTPLNAIGGYAELMELGIRGPVTNAQREDLARIRQSQRHLLGLINEVLDLAKADAGTLRVAREPVPAGHTVDAALALVRPQAAAKGLALSEACSGAADVPYLGDEPRVRQVLVNLLANAVKFTAPGGRVAAGCAVTDAPPRATGLPAGAPYVALRVEDTGTGIPAAELARIFEPFTQVGDGVNPYTRTRGGTGLGPAISRRLARLMGGDLTVESQVGAGSAFTLWLPAPERRAAPRATPAGGLPGVSGAPAAGAAGVYPAPPPGASAEGTAPDDAGRAGTAGALARLGEWLLTQVGPVLDAYLARLRTDPPALPDLRAHSDAVLEDHAATVVTDVALAVRVLADAGGEPSALLRDGTAILGVIAERHGAQRARLGWPEAAIRREFVLLGEALDAALARAGRPGEGAALARAREATRHLLEQAARVSVGGYRVAMQAAAPEDAR